MVRPRPLLHRREVRLLLRLRPLCRRRPRRRDRRRPCPDRRSDLVQQTGSGSGIRPGRDRILHAVAILPAVRPPAAAVPGRIAGGFRVRTAGVRARARQIVPLFGVHSVSVVLRGAGPQDLLLHHRQDLLPVCKFILFYFFQTFHKIISIVSLSI